MRAEIGDGLFEGVDPCGVGVEGEVIENGVHRDEQIRAGGVAVPHVRGGGFGLIAGPPLESDVGNALPGSQQRGVVVQGGDLLLLGAHRVDGVQVGGELLLEPAGLAGVGSGVDGHLLRVDRFGIPLLPGQVSGAAYVLRRRRDGPRAVGDADQRITAGTDPALVAGQALLDGRTQVSVAFA